MGTTVLGSQILGEPMNDVGSQPTDRSAVKPLFPRESAKHRHAQQYPLRPARKPRDVVSAQELLPGRESLIHIFGKGNVPGESGRRRTLFGRGILRVHKRPSTCGSGRLGSSCHVWRHHAQAAKSIPALFSLKLSESLNANFSRAVPAEIALSRQHPVLQQLR